MARIKALGRRSESFKAPLLKFGNVTLDSNRYEMSTLSESVRLTNKEYQLLELFIHNPGHVFSTEYLMDKVWGCETESDIDVVWTHIGFVRKKLRAVKADIEIKTMRGAGYAMEEIK